MTLRPGPPEGAAVDVIRTLKALYPHTIVGIKDSGCQREPSLALATEFIDHLMVYVGWRRVRPPLVALGDAEFDRLAAELAAYGIDRERD